MVIKQKGTLSSGFFETPLYASSGKYRKNLWGILSRLFDIILKM